MNASPVVRAVGTAFNVKLAGPNLEVLVTEGTVRVSQPTSPAPAPTPSSDSPAAPAPVVLAALTAGQRTVIAVAPAIAPPVVVPASTREIVQLLEWQPRLLNFISTQRAISPGLCPSRSRPA